MVPKYLEKRKRGYVSLILVWPMLRYSLSIHQVINVKLSDLPHHKTRSSLAELTRPARAIKRKYKNETKATSGRKQKRLAQDAKYHNWFTPFTWALIEKAARNAGWEMSPSAIVREAKKIDALVFENLKRTTVAAWIDRS